jgi:glutaredoxin
MTARVLQLLFALLLSLSLFGCTKKKDDPATADPASVAATIVIKPESDGLLLTWIDEKGEFHVEQKVADVPLTGRDAVRVVDPTRDEGSHSDLIFVADLRQTKPDGTYPVTTMTRADFEKLATARRAKNGPVLANADDGTPKPPAQGTQPSTGTPGTPSPADPAGRPTVIIYGAEWCGPCKQTKAYLTQRKVTFVEKDIDDEANQKEMLGKLARARIVYKGAIPVIDVRGTILVGFDPETLDHALGTAL